MDWMEIRTLDAGSWLEPRYAGERVPTLDDVLERYARRTQLLLEIKARANDRRVGANTRLAEAVASRIQRRRLQQCVLVACFDLDTLGLVMRGATSVHTVLNYKPPRRMTRSLEQAASRVWALSFDVRTLTPRIVDAVHDRGKPVLAYTCNTNRTVKRAVLADVDGVISDRPSWLRAKMDVFRQ